MTEQNDNFNPLVRISSVDIDGHKALFYGLTRIKGVSFSYSNAACNISGLDRTKKLGNMTPDEILKIEDIIQNPHKYNFPIWLLNRRNDFETGDDKHLLTSDIKFTLETDLRRLQRIKSRRGLRHSWRLPVRGQRTKGNFRKGSAIGVKRKK